MATINGKNKPAEQAAVAKTEEQTTGRNITVLVNEADDRVCLKGLWRKNNFGDNNIFLTKNPNGMNYANGVSVTQDLIMKDGDPEKVVRVNVPFSDRDSIADYQYKYPGNDKVYTDDKKYNLYPGKATDTVQVTYNKYDENGKRAKDENGRFMTEKSSYLRYDEIEESHNRAEAIFEKQYSEKKTKGVVKNTEEPAPRGSEIEAPATTTTPTAQVDSVDSTDAPDDVAF